MWPTVPFPLELGIPDRFVNFITPQILEPRLDVAARNHNHYTINSSRTSDSALRALLTQLAPPSRGGSGIGVDDHHQERLLPAANCLQLPRKLFPNQMLSGTSSSGQLASRDVTPAEVAVTQKPSDEQVRLPVLAEKDDLRAHLSHPLATNSDNARPSFERSGSFLTRTGPSSSRKNHLAFAPM